MTKKEKRKKIFFIASKLSNKKIHITDCRVKLLMAISEKELEKLNEKAHAVMSAKIDFRLLWEERIDNCTPEFLKKIDYH